MEYRQKAAVGPNDDDCAQEEEAYLNGEENGVVNSGEVPEKVPDAPNAVRITTPYMTKYERARILGTRALQIS